jgi:Transcriptional regulator/sugar kinase
VSAASAQAIGIDVGGTKTAALRVATDGEILDRAVLETPSDDMQAILDMMVEAAKSVLAPEVRAIGVGAAGLVEAGTGRLIFAPNLAWRNALLTDHLWDAIGLPAFADNDNNVAAWGEYRHGAARGYRHVLFVGVGTGIGGGIIVDGRLLRGAHGFAAEIGHIIVEPGGPLCGCGNHGCWEQLASGHALTRAGRDAASQHPQSMIARRVGGDPAKVTGPLVTDAPRAGDPVARGILARVGRRLGEGIAGLVNVLDPEIVVVGGGVAAAGELLLGSARVAFATSMEAPAHRPEVPLVVATLGNDAGAVGAATLALEELG